MSCWPLVSGGVVLKNAGCKLDLHAGTERVKSVPWGYDWGFLGSLHPPPFKKK